MTYIDKCPVGCGDDFSSTPVALAEGELRRCEHCGQLVSQCTEQRYWDSMQEFDSSEGTLPTGKAALRSFLVHEKRLLQAARLLGKPLNTLRLLDIGCSTGAFLRSALKLGVEAQGVEPAPRACASACAYGLKVHQGRVEDQCLDSNFFDIITLFEVIEHLKAPTVVLSEAYRLLKPGGVMIIGTGNTDSWTAKMMLGRWDYYQINHHGGHVSFFNPHSITKLVEGCGFEVSKIITRRVRFYEKDQISKPVYMLTKMCAELLNFPATLLRKGHDMCVYIRKPL